MTYYELLQKISAGGGLAYTHSGIFHADEVFASALLRMIFPSIQIIRSRDVPPEFPGLVFDQGYGEFDHHQVNKEYRKNGIPYATFGLIWKTIAPSVYGLDVYRMVDSRFVQLIDDADNGGKPCSISNAIRSLNPTWNEDSSPAFIQSAFERAVAMAYAIFERQIEVAQADLMAKPIIEQAIEKSKNGIVELPRHINCIGRLIPDGRAKILMYPTANSSDNWNVQTIPVTPGSRVQKIPLASYEDDYLNGVKYRNANGFLATCEDYESAKKLADLSVAA